jgi:hypothetical protein
MEQRVYFCQYSTTSQQNLSHLSSSLHFSVPKNLVITGTGSLLVLTSTTNSYFVFKQALLSLALGSMDGRLRRVFHS